MFPDPFPGLKRLSLADTTLLLTNGNTTLALNLARANTWTGAMTVNNTINSNSTITGSVLVSNNYIQAASFVIGGSYGGFASGVYAGSQSSPSSTLQTAGSLALKVTRRTSGGTLDSTETQILADATTAAACSGTPTYQCSHWTSQGDCETNTSHGSGCTWNSNACSAFNGTDSSTCTTGHSGCTWDSASCVGPGDQSTCEAQDDSYGGSCSWVVCSSYSDSGSCTGAGCTWNSSSCTDFNGNQGSCQGTSGCTWDTANCNVYDDNYASCTGTMGCTWSAMIDCSTLDSTDQTTCEAATGCVWNAGDNTCYGTCSGSYDLGTCSGNYNESCTGDYCTGTYNTGNCSGTYGDCTGTVTCGSFGTETPCTNETGCTWINQLDLYLPAISSVPDRTYWIQNDTSGGNDVVLHAQAGDDIEGSSTLTLGNYRDSIHLAPFRVSANCDTFNDNYAGCNSASGCSWSAGGVNCADFDSTDQSTCEANSGCVWNGPQCQGTCSGTYITVSRWHEFGNRRTLPVPLAGTKVYYVANSSGGAVTRKLTFTDGILTSET